MASIEQSIRNLRKLKADIQTIAGNEMVNAALDNIRAEKDIHGKPMKARKAGSVRNAGRKLLVDSGTGRRSIDDKITGTKVELVADVHMVAHNDGVNKTVSARSRKGRGYTKKMNLPQREFATVPVERINKVIANRIVAACT